MHEDYRNSPKNTIGSDIESLLGNPKLDLAALTVFDKAPLDPQPSISPASASNITTRKKSKTRSRHFKGRLKTKSLFQGDLYDFREVPISSIDEF